MKPLKKNSPADVHVGDIVFSENTYQVEVKDSETHWPLIQISDEGECLDALCSCPDSTDRMCVHSLAAYEKILGRFKIPLHVRFKRSLWYQIAEICSRRHGYVAHEKDIKEGSFSAFSPTGKRLFYLKALSAHGKAEFKKIFMDRVEKDESNSLEFSNRSPDEIKLWKENRPSHSLQFALCFWNDLAKWWMRLQEEGGFVRLELVGEKLPKAFKISFSEVEIYFYVAEANWARIIPTLNTIPSPLKVFEQERGVTTYLRYDELRRGFYVIKKPGSKKPQGIEEVVIGSWIFVPHEGFYPAQVKSIFQKNFIEKEEVANLLNLHEPLMQKVVENAKISPEKHKARYHLFLDDRHRLHICLYVFTYGDLSTERAALFENWVYIPSSGFIELSDVKFPLVETMILKEEIIDFITENKAWLSEQPAFETHVSSLQTELSYRLEPQEELQFFKATDSPDFSEDVVDFGEWIYVKGRGFFSKKTADVFSVLKPGLKISSKDIASFINNNREELQNISLFFAKTCPIKEAKLLLTLDDKDRIIVKPHYELLEGYDKEALRFFGQYAYVEGEGFSEIPKNKALPENFQKEKIIPAYEVKIFLQTVLPQLRSIVIMDPRLKPVESCALIVDSLTEEKRGMWVFSLQYSTDLGKIPIYEIWKGAKQRKPYAFTSAGLFDLSDPRFNWLLQLHEEAFEQDRTHLSSLDWYKIKLYEEPILDPGAESSTQQLFESLKEFHPKEGLNLTGLKSDLRGYQEVGVRWLFSLYLLGLSGLLCDEMGLGKTHQAMGLLQASANCQEAKGSKFLIVCPTSVIYHWEAQLRRFLPGIPLLVFYGAKRSLTQFAKQEGILLTSYGLLRTEQKKIGEQKFEIAIFDELQVAKNAASKTHRSLKLVNASMRVGLSGTPIENRLEELKALFDVVLPHFLPKTEAFREEFVYPIEKYKDEMARQKLQKMIHPFLLRRRKQEVLKELPEKVEEIAYCSLSDEQKKLYVEAVASSKRRLMDEVSQTESSVSVIHIFALLTKLKRICDHPSLITREAPSFDTLQSGKWELFIQLLAEARESGQKVVVFSQYLEMLDIIETYLTQNGIGFSAVRGSTQNRREQIQKFQEDPSIEVFVASLQAVGVGIDLTAASVVIHYDRWWNPAKENQATDRVHRIGQSRGVQVFKMITKGTIEERIHELIERKKSLSKDVLPHEDDEELRTLSKEELMNILLTLEENPDNLGPSIKL